MILNGQWLSRNPSFWNHIRIIQEWLHDVTVTLYYLNGVMKEQIRKKHWKTPKISSFSYEFTHARENTASNIITTWRFNRWNKCGCACAYMLHLRVIIFMAHKDTTVIHAVLFIYLVICNVSNTESLVSKLKFRNHQVSATRMNNNNVTAFCV